MSTKRQHEARSEHAVAIVAGRIVRETKRTTYQHGIYVDPATGTCCTDCSGFVSLVLEEVAPVHYGAIPRVVDHPYPRAFEFFDYFADQATSASYGWRQIECVADVVAGDVMAWRKRYVDDRDDSGHVAVVAARPQVVAPGVWAVRILDATDVRHFDDSRVSNGSFKSGVGTGTILVHVDGRERATSFQFGPYDAVHELPIVVGRLEALTPGR